MSREHRFPPQPAPRQFKLREFLGVDFTTHESEVNTRRSPDAVNLISGQTGSMDKRFGLKKVTSSLTAPALGLTSIGYIYAQHDGLSGYQYYNEYRQAMLFGSGTSIYFCGGNQKVLNPYSTPVVLNIYNTVSNALETFTYQGLKPRFIKLSQYLYMLISDEITPDKPVIYAEPIKTTYFVKIVEKSRNAYYNEPVYDLGFNLGNFTEAYILDPFELVVQTKLNIKIPTTQIARTPNGLTSTVFEGTNLLTSSRINTFASNGTATQYVVDKTIASLVSVQTLNSDGTWANVTGSTFTGKTVTLLAAPPVTPIAGQDNVKITFRINTFEHFSIINNFRNFGYYGFNGNADFVFFIQRTEIKWNRDWRMNLKDLYIDENGYTDFGTEDTRIIGYGLRGNEQIIFSTKTNKMSSVFIRSSSLDGKGELIFPNRSGVSNVGAINGDTFASLRGDAIWQSEYGVNALITNDITNVQSVQDRGFYINDSIKGVNEYSHATVFDNKYFLFINGECYIADSRNKYNERLAPSESFQYDWYYWEFYKNVYSSCIIDEELYLGFGTQIYKYKNESDSRPYQDEIIGTDSAWLNATSYSKGNIVSYLTKYYICLKPHTSDSVLRNPLNSYYWNEIEKGTGVYYVPVLAYWTTPIMNMGDMTSLKTLKNLWVRLGKYAYMSARIYYSTQGVILEKYDGIFDFSNIDFSRFTFSTDTDPSVLVANRQQRKFNSIQFKVESRDSNPFSLLEIVGEFIFNGKFKG